MTVYATSVNYPTNGPPQDASSAASETPADSAGTRSGEGWSPSTDPKRPTLTEPGGAKPSSPGFGAYITAGEFASLEWEDGKRDVLNRS